MTMAAAWNDGQISERDFDSLPPTLRRKYFSSLERLRLVHDGLFPKSSSVHPHPFSQKTSHLRRRSLGRRSASDPHVAVPAAHRKRLRRASSVKRQHLVNTEIATWFSSLPPAIQRKHFTREEQLILSRRRDSFILDAADEALYKRGRRRTQSAQTSVSTNTAKTEEDIAARSSSLTNSSDEMEEFNTEDCRWLDDDAELDLRLDDYHTAIAETVQKTSAHHNRQVSFRRNLSLSSVPFRRSSTSSIHASTPSPTPANQGTLHPRPLSALLTPRHHQPRNSLSSIDPRAKHYQDPEARLRLRVYLASPQKFDEAVEFGFPSIHEDHPARHPKQKSSPKASQDAGRTFFSINTPSLSADEDESDDEVLREAEYPRTPEEAMFRSRLPSRKGATNAGGVAHARIVRTLAEPYVQASASDREMTLHMTLTRPDLRSDVDSAPVRNINEEPLEQPALSSGDMMQSIWDTLPPEKSRMKKFWSRILHR